MDVLERERRESDTRSCSQDLSKEIPWISEEREYEKRKKSVHGTAVRSYGSVRDDLGASVIHVFHEDILQSWRALSGKVCI